MKSLYRITPRKRKKGNRWTVQRILDRTQAGKAFIKKADAKAYKFELDAKSVFTERSSPIDKLSVEDIDNLSGHLKVFFKKLNTLKQTIAVKNN